MQSCSSIVKSPNFIAKVCLDFSYTCGKTPQSLECRPSCPHVPAAKKALVRPSTSVMSRTSSTERIPGSCEKTADTKTTPTLSCAGCSSRIDGVSPQCQYPRLAQVPDLLSAHPKNPATEGIPQKEISKKKQTHIPANHLARYAHIPTRHAHFTTRCFHASRRQTKKVEPTDGVSTS